MEEYLTKLIKKITLREKLIAEITEINKNLDTEEEKLNGLKIKLDEAKANKEKIEEISLNIMLSILSGDSEEKSTLKDEEYFTIKNEYNLCKDTVNNYKNHLDELIKRRDDLECSNKEVTYYNNYVERLIKDSKSDENNTKENIEYLKKLICKLIDIEESVIACDRCKIVLKNAMLHLNNAKNWGVCKISNNNKSTSFKKHNKIIHSKKELNKFNYELKNLNYRLKELNRDSSFVGLKIPKIFYNFNILYDNIFLDESIQMHIKRTLRRLQDEKYKLDELYTELKKNKFLIEDKIFICSKDLINIT